MAYNFREGLPRSGFQRNFIQEFEARYPDLVRHLRAGIVGTADRLQLQVIASESRDMKYASAFYLRKYIRPPIDMKSKEFEEGSETQAAPSKGEPSARRELAKVVGEHPFLYGRRLTLQFIDSCFGDQNFSPYYQDRDRYLDAFLSFMYDKPRIFKHYSNIVRAWEISQVSLSHIARHGRDEDGAAGRSDQGSGSGPGGRLPGGFDPG